MFNISLVQELVNPFTGEWNEEVLDANFEAVDVQAILQTPLGHLDEDLWAWQLERHGNFSVRSAYRALLQASTVNNPVTGSRGTEQSFWKNLWRLRVPPKVRNYWWRVIKGFIPCREVLRDRHIEKIPFCKSCGRVESIKHALFECTWAKLFWEEVKSVTNVKVPDLHPNTWAIDLIDSDKVDQRDAAVILCGGWAMV
jgi:hypothetical protein